MKYDDYNVKDLITTGEQIVLQETFEYKSGFSKKRRQVLLTNKKFIHANEDGVTAWSLKSISNINLADCPDNSYEYFMLDFNNGEHKFYFKKEYESFVKKLYNGIVLYMG